MRQDEHCHYLRDGTTAAAIESASSELECFRLPSASCGSEETRKAIDVLETLEKLFAGFVDEAPEEFEYINRDFPEVLHIFQRNLECVRQVAGSRADTTVSSLVACARLLPYLVNTMVDRLNLDDELRPNKQKELSRVAQSALVRCLRFE